MNITLTQILKPLKLLIFIQPKNKESYRRAVKLCSSLWGGKHFPIIPFFEKFGSAFKAEYQVFMKQPEFYTNTIRNFNPNYIIIDENVRKESVQLIAGHREIITIKEIEDSLVNDQSAFGISVIEVLNTYKEAEF